MTSHLLNLKIYIHHIYFLTRMERISYEENLDGKREKLPKIKE
jgi:hypothetical protein